MWLCWELLVIGEPILVIGDTPKGASDAVFALVELIKPIPFGGDFRPYFTIQDSDFKNIAYKGRAPPSATILGVTNPVFSKLLEQWPHVIKVKKPTENNVQNDLSSTERPQSSSRPALNIGRSSPIPENHGIVKGDFSSIYSAACKHKPFFSKDKKLMKEVVEAALRGGKMQSLNNMIRRHFVELTDRFLQPLNRHFESLVVGNHMNMALSTLQSQPKIRPFKQESFLKMVETTPPLLPVALKRPLTDLYRAFLMSPNFASWLQGKTADVYRLWRKRYLQVICQADLRLWSITIGQVETVDLLLRIREELNRYSSYFELEGNEVKFANPRIDDFDCNNPHTYKPLRSPAAVLESSPLRMQYTIDSVFTNSRQGSVVETKTSSPSNDYLQFFRMCETPATLNTECNNKRCTRTLIGSSIPSTEEFDGMLRQFDTLLKILPEDLRTSVLKKDL